MRTTIKNQAADEMTVGRGLQLSSNPTIGGGE